jgi:acyl-CoA thioester hydrolase
MQVKIYYHHTDAGGVVYYAEYLKFLEEARTELLCEKGVSVKTLAQAGTLFVVRRQEIEYLRPAFYADVLTVSVRISAMTGATLTFEGEITNERKEQVAGASTILVCVGSDFKPKAIPREIRKKLC